MGKLRPNWTAQATIANAQTSVSIPISNGGYETVWVIEQIGVSYSVNSDAPAASVYFNGQLYSGPAQFIPLGSSLGQSFGGQPYLYAESDDDLEVVITNGSAGAIVNIQVQYRVISYGHDELSGRY